ncbi:glutathione S-transferase family protein [Frateuria aurantia]
MFDLYAFPTPNSLKIPIALEELGLDYRLHVVNIRQGEQRHPDFLALNPNAKVPVLVEHAPTGERMVLSESAAILVHLAESSGRLLPASGVERARVFEQLFFHASALGPAFGQAGFFQRLAAEPQPLAIERFTREAHRVLSVLDGQLAHRPFVAGTTFSIADIAHYGWLWRRAFAGIELDDTPNIARWFQEITERPAVQRAIKRLEELAPA